MKPGKFFGYMIWQSVNQLEKLLYQHFGEVLTRDNVPGNLYTIAAAKSGDLYTVRI